MRTERSDSRVLRDDGAVARLHTHQVESNSRPCFFNKARNSPSKLIFLYPALTRWANLWRAYGAGRMQSAVRGCGSHAIRITGHRSRNMDHDSLGWQNTLRSAVQIFRLNLAEANEHFRHTEQDQRHASGRAQGRLASLRVRDVRVRDGRAVWARRHGDDERTGADAALSPVYSIVLVHSGFAGGGGIDNGDSRRRRILPLGARGVWRLLGISGRLVELERFVPSGRHVRRSDGGLSDLFLPWACRLEALRDCRRRDCADRLHQRARHPDGRRGGDGSGNFHSAAYRGAVRDRGNEVAPQSVFAAGAAACSAVSSLRRGAGAGFVALLRLRTSVQRGGRSGKSATELSDRADHRRAAVDSDVFSADDVFARRARRLRRATRAMARHGSPSSRLRSFTRCWRRRRWFSF